MPAPLTAAELAAALRVTAETVHEWAKAGRIPYSQIGRRRLFDLNEVLQATRHAAQPRLAIVGSGELDDYYRIAHGPSARPGGRSTRDMKRAARRANV